MRPALLLGLLLIACRPSSSQQASGQTAAPAQPLPSTPVAASPAAAGASGGTRIRMDAKQTECVERWLQGHGLDAYGNPEGTMYAGGTPTFDEATGKSVDRWTLVARNRPEALQSCAVAIPP